MKRALMINLLARRIMSTTSVSNHVQNCFSNVSDICTCLRFFFNYNIQQKPIEESISKKLASKFQPQHLEVINESSKHNVPKGE